MELSITQTHTSPVIDEFAERLEILNLMYYASEAGAEMEFGSLEELHHSVKQAMELCISAGIPLKGNFQRIYKSFDDGLTYDWKLSLLGYRLVCLNGYSANPKVARMIIQLIKNHHLNQL